ncbi:DUF3367 domain-containing protein [Gordonia hydrophobica]|uniref:DUF3367 domain-containing protein n=1 Tax=Gordonia hydrophobica TaxID=40516 RepID=A0ABZ2U733_9ACTN|nr:DUF3367 domain-containing protein [Gordonia hydrophobica]MBM7365584.1 arabinofuranan 3-O-arabinosyltransferase [Gordonia hydrophobica]
MTAADRTLRRRDGVVVAAIALLVSFLQRPGLISPDTKLDLTADPIGFLTRAAHLWSPTAPMGQVQNQAYGYFFPHGAFFALGDVLHLPPWITQRLWWAILLTVGFLGIVRLAEALRIGSFWSRLIAAWAFVLAPRVMTTLGTISSETLPMMLAPWVLLPVVRALDDRRSPRPLWADAARSACAIALMGAVNAVATVAAVAVTVIWWLMVLVRDPERRRTLVFGGWWCLGAAAACLWWIVPLLILSRISPPFLDFIESSRVTTEWTSLTEVLRGTDSWTPFVSSERAVGAVLVSEPAAVVATGVVAAAGLAGLTMRAMPFRGRFLVLLVVGLLAICLGYPGGLSSPVRDAVVAVLDGPGAALRNIHKFDPLVRLPLVLGIAHLLSRVRLPAREAHVERGFAAALVVVIAAFGSGSLLWTGGLAPASSYRDIPAYWHDAADWLRDAQRDSASPTRALVVPGAPFADQLWGLTRDEPLQALAQEPWAVRDAIPLTPPGAIRAMDSVERALSSGRGSPGLAATLAQQGVGYVVLRADLDPSSRSARPLSVAQAITRSPGITQVAQFGPTVAPPTLDGVVVDDGLRPKLPAITVYRVDGAAGGPTLVDVDAMPRVSGGPESLLSVEDARRRAGLGPLGPALLAADAARAGLPPSSMTVTDTPVDREVDFGRVDDHSSAIRAPDDPRLTKNRVADYPVDGQPLVHAQWLLDNQPGQVRVTTSGSAADATQPGRTSPANAAAAAFDDDAETAWVSRGLESAVGQRMTVQFTRPRTDLAVTVTTAKAIGPDVTSVLISTDTGSTVAQGLEPGVPTRVLAPAGSTSRVEVRAIATANGSGGNQFAIADLALADANSGVPLTIRQRTVLPTLDAADRVEQWVLGPELGQRSDCVTARDGRVRCSPALGLSSETPGVFGRTLSVPTTTVVDPTVTLRPTPGGELSALLARPGVIHAEGQASVSDPLGNASAAVDGDADTTWVAPSPSVSDRKKYRPRLTLRLPTARDVSGLRIQTPDDYPARPTRVTVELRYGDRRVSTTTATVGDDGTVRFASHRADTVVITVEKRSDLININDLGFAEDAPVGISEVQVLPGATNQPFDDARPVEIRCDSDPRGPYGLGVSASGQVIRLQVATTAGALRRGEPVTATRCPGPPLTLAAGEQEVSVNPGAAFTVDAVSLRVPDAGAPSTTATHPHVDRWDATRRAVTVDAADADRVLVVPESTNPGWHARIDGRDLTSVVVNGWQQGWLVPAGTAGTVALTYDLDSPYRWALGLGLAAMAALFLLTALHAARGAPPHAGRVGRGAPPHAGRVGRGAPLLHAPPHAGRVGRGASRDRIETAAPRNPTTTTAPTNPTTTLTTTLTLTLTTAALLAAFLLTGPWGAAIAAVTGAVVWRLPERRRPVLTFGAMLAATAVLAAGPWHSGVAYTGDSAWGQALALIAVTAAVASAIVRRRE